MLRESQTLILNKIDYTKMVSDRVYRVELGSTL
jgi:hypothetical protein